MDKVALELDLKIRAVMRWEDCQARRTSIPGRGMGKGAVGALFRLVSWNVNVYGKVVGDKIRKVG